jgi:hypothetical protein
MLRFVSGVMLPVAFGMLCCCNSSSPPPVESPPLPIASRIQPSDPSKYAAYEDVPWNEWKNPRVIVTSEGIKVLLSGTSDGSTVPPERVGDVLAKTTSSDWPLGLIVMIDRLGQRYRAGLDCWLGFRWLWARFGNRHRPAYHEVHVSVDCRFLGLGESFLWIDLSNIRRCSAREGSNLPSSG